ncbi:MAG TPA: GPW/gp25 family protein [Crinalium sp.]|jgi:hypothetical protein
MSDITRDHSQAHLGAGWAFPLRVNVRGGLQISSTAQNVEESINIILRTELGERVYRPNFGSRLSELAFAPMNTKTLLLLRLHIQEALEMWEPRITLEDVRTDPDPIRGCVNLILSYRLKDSPDFYSLVYPFYLMPSE